MNALMNAPGSARKLLVIPALGLAAAAVLVSTTWGQQSASGADEDKSSSEFTVLGDGELPTAKPALGEPREPLSAKETGYAIHVASTDASIPATATDVRGGAGPEFLFADLPDDVDSTKRLAVVHLYDYTANVGYQQVVDLSAGRVTSSVSGKKVQAPTSADEADVAMELAIAAGDKLAFAQEFEQVQGVPLVSTDQVEYVSGTFVYDGSTVGGKECGADRCAQLMVQTGSGAYLGTWDFVVNLTDQSIVEIG